MDIYILREGKETGPFSEETTHQMLKQGTVLINDLAWRPGMPQWIPLHSVLYPAPPPPPPPVPEPAKSPVSTEPATAKQKAFLNYMGIPVAADLGKEQAALLVNDAMEDPKNSARVSRWNDERFKLHPDLFAAELQAKKEGRSEQYFNLCQSEGAEVVHGITKAHCQVLVGYLDVKFPNWDANPTEGLWNFFFPAVAEKFPALVSNEWKERLKYPQGPKVAAGVQRRYTAGPVVSSSPKHQSSSPVASLAKGLLLGFLVVGVVAGGLIAYKRPEVFAQAKAKLAGDKKPSRSNTVQASASAAPATASDTASASAESSTPAVTGATPSTGDSLFADIPSAGAGQSGDAASAIPAPGGSDGPPSMDAGSGMMEGASDSSTMAGTTPAMPEPAAASGSTGGDSPFGPPGGSSSSSSTTTTAAADPSESAFPPVPAADSAALPGPKTTVMLTRPYEVQLPYGKITVPAGRQLPLVGQEGIVLKVRFQNQVVSVPANVTDIESPTP